MGARAGHNVSQLQEDKHTRPTRHRLGEDNRRVNVLVKKMAHRDGTQTLVGMVDCQPMQYL